MISYRTADILKQIKHTMTMDVAPNSITFTFSNIGDGSEVMNYLSDTCDMSFVVVRDRVYRHFANEVGTDRAYNNILNAMKINAMEPETSPRTPSLFTFTLTQNFLYKKADILKQFKTIKEGDHVRLSELGMKTVHIDSQKYYNNSIGLVLSVNDGAALVKWPKTNPPVTPWRLEYLQKVMDRQADLLQHFKNKTAAKFRWIFDSNPVDDILVTHEDETNVYAEGPWNSIAAPKNSSYGGSIYRRPGWVFATHGNRSNESPFTENGGHKDIFRNGVFVGKVLNILPDGQITMSIGANIDPTKVKIEKSDSKKIFLVNI